MIFRATRAGAEDFLSKPLDMKELDARMSRILERQAAAPVAPQLRDTVRSGNEFSMLFGASPKMEDVKMTIEKVADTNVTVLIRGESGTGKEMVARMVYANSGRHDKPFVKAVLTETVLKKEGMVRFLRVSIDCLDGVRHASPSGDQKTAILGTLARADGIAVLPADRSAFEAGETVDVHLLYPGYRP